MRLIPERIAVQLVDLFGTLSDASRIRILSLVRDQELSVGILAEQLDLSESAASRQFAGLRPRRMAASHRQGRQVFCPLSDIREEQLIRLGLGYDGGKAMKPPFAAGRVWLADLPAKNRRAITACLRLLEPVAGREFGGCRPWRRCWTETRA